MEPPVPARRQGRKPHARFSFQNMQQAPGNRMFSITQDVSLHRRVRPAAQKALCGMGFLALIAAVCIGPVARSPAGQQPAEAGKPATAAARKREAKRLISRFRRAKTDPATRESLVEQVLVLGPEAVELLCQQVERELHPQIARYRELYYRQAVKLVSQRAAQVDLVEVARLRQAVLALRERPDLTKEMIEQIADPALQRLNQLLLLPPEAVCQSAPKLNEMREPLMQLGVLWERCARYQYEQLPEEIKPKRPPSFAEYLEGEESLATGLALPMDPTTRQVFSANARLAARLDPEEARAILALNITRALLGLKPLAIDPRLCAAARDHSSDMHNLKFFSHQSPVPGKTSFTDRARRFGTTASGENIAAGYRNGEAVHRGWFHSPGHHKNQMANHKRVGVGRVGNYYTQLFGG